MFTSVGVFYFYELRVGLYIEEKKKEEDKSAFEFLGHVPSYHLL